MKAINKHISLTLGIVLLAACTNVDYPDRFVQTYGLPKVDFIRYADKDVVITQANMEEVICIVGENLTSIHDLYFNDQQAVLNTSYITDNTLIVSVPKNMPVVQTDKIYMNTICGETVTYGFKVLPPAPRVTSMSLEWAQPGQTVTIYGSYLFAPLTVEFPGVDPVEVTSSAGTSVDVKVPEGAQPGKIKVTTASGTAQSVFMYKDSRGMLFDFDGLTGLGNHGWHDRDILADENSISGNYVQLGDGETEMSENGGWNDGLFSFEYWCGSWDTPQKVTSGEGIALHHLVDFSDYANMALKFEMMIPSANPWSAGAMQIAFEGYDLVTLSGNEIEGYDGTPAGANAWVFNNENNDMGAWGRALYRPWTASNPYHTGDKWITVTIPLADFNYTYVGEPAESGPSKAEDFASLTIFVLGGGVDGTACTPIIKIDNIRAVPYK